MIRRATFSSEPRQPDRVSSSDQLFQGVARRVDSLSRILRSPSNGSHFKKIAEMLAGLPLATEEFAVAMCRLQNAHNSARQGEYGAARYELRLLSRSLFGPV